MDSIYRNAEATVIASDVEDPKYGLPGVGYRKRSPQAYARIGNHFLISSMGDPMEEILDSKWKTRAWTYQEALLSRRRLVFTDQQVYYECYGMHCCEALNFPLLDLHSRNRQALKKPFCRGKNIGVFPRGVGNSPLDVIRRINEYSKLELTNSSDILKGILGILSAFERSSLKISHHLGVPLLPPSHKADQSVRDNWTPAMSFFSGLCWKVKTPSARRPGFPSWSWTGWYGIVEWEYDVELWPPIQVDPGVQFRVELTDRRILDCRTVQEPEHRLNVVAELTNFIHISAWTSSISIVKTRIYEKGRCTGRINLEDGGYIEWNFDLNTEVVLLPDQLCAGIHLSEEFMDDSLFSGPPLMIVCKIGDGIERIGFGWVTIATYSEFDKNGVWDGRTFMPMDHPIPNLVRSWQEIRVG